MRKLSIKLRVSIWYTLIIAVISLITLFAMLSVSEKVLINDAKDKIVHAVDNLADPPKENASNTKKGDIPPARNDERMDIGKMPQFRFFENGVHTAVFDSGHNLIAGSIPFEFADEISLADFELKEKTYNGERFLTYVRQRSGQGEDENWVVGVVSVADESSMLRSVTKTNLILLAILIIVAGLGGFLILHQAFKPVNRISNTARDISESNDLSQRIALGEGKDEIYSLARTFDEMLDKIETTLENEKQFTSDASHELRTPVAVITSECEYVLDCADSLEDAKESVESIKRQSDKMSKLIDELLTMTRMDRNTQRLNFEDVDISELLSFVCDEQEEIHDSSKTLVRSIAPDIHSNADHLLLTRLFINLISNAYQYGKDGGTITVTLEKDNSNIVFSVADDGIGIAKEHLPKIWERFYQVDSSRTNGSMGLGLSMVKWIAECHNGTVTVESELGKGSRFVFVMPENKDDKYNGNTA